MSKPYTYTYADKYEDDLTIHPSVDGPGLAYVTAAHRGVVVPASELPNFVAALYRAAGQEPPILLPRPDAAQLLAEGWVTNGRVQVAKLDADDVSPDEARTFAAYFAAAAELAEVPQLDPEQVEQLSELIDNSALLSRGDAETIATAVLRAGYTRGEA